ncbi:DUF3310 domain-containing protein [Streptomyces sp. NPDC052020]|uniref:DUF3310 domain-containing protein n=1 Tax=Streptomyces sp. NPDC052020 TaxID=3155677 RepID=UPI003445ED10
MKFNVGQSVEISKPSTAYTEHFRGQRGFISKYREDEMYPYEVTFPKGNILAFAGEELSPTDPSYPENVDEAADCIAKVEDDMINHPSHYTWLPNGVEVIDITELLPFNTGNVVKYVLRAGRKHGEPITDLRKAAWYINREIERLEAAA